MNKKLPAFTLTELMMVLVIIGILILLALPNLQGIIGQAHSLEAQKQLKYIQNLEKAYYQQHFQYTDNFQALHFEPPVLKSAGGDGVYIYEIINASKEGFTARATASEDFDEDGQMNVWEIGKTGSYRETVPD
ncbi:type IV pilin protein [Aureispira anguillae]|uniref:Prepilin-type N-terminal cleavage/methylation domain-containing protein n=1 Tax=Aureispira anguillae TaxID=2864201 RepID=A0A915YJP5_9BACT|nr:prepilin-type N-terminal cleavage/methylation domain-containing protein [Aureispira anguillae]BDS14310.1 prepilin-type N-terminal cleavage/methylation domain-containing protein [Aureispira anguillae]